MLKDSIMTGSFPDELKILKVVAVHKAADKQDPYNYRPIAVLPIIALIYGELCNEDNVLGNGVMNSFGFRSLHSTPLALSKSVDHWLMNVDNGKMNSVVFLDIRKAFGAHSKFLGGGRVGRLCMCHPFYHPVDLQSKILNFCHLTLLKVRFKITVTPSSPPQKRQSQDLRVSIKL